MLACARGYVEERCLAAVGVADKGDVDHLVFLVAYGSDLFACVVHGVGVGHGFVGQAVDGGFHFHEVGFGTAQ